MKIYTPSKVSVNASPEDMAAAINSGNGILILSDLPKAPFTEFQSTLRGLSTRPDLVSRLNNAYKSNLVYKDSFANNNGGACVDMKRVLDLSPERLDEISRNEPNFDLLKTGSLKNTLDYWMSLTKDFAPKIGCAVAYAIGSDDVLKDASFNYRMVDYYPRDVNDINSFVAPRCGDHRDFGSWTLVFPDEMGFQVFMNGEWMDVPRVEEGSALLLFGWCTQIRSNGRIPAVLHRVSDAEGVDRRTSGVLFCAPKMEETALEPVVLANEERVYVSGIKAGNLRGSMRRKWKKREGTLSEEEKILEEKEILATNMWTQDDVVHSIA
eukprot:scaffold388056_cov73-Cyclotella_meneghiniana.AAC.1